MTYEVENTIDAILESSQIMSFSKEKVFGNELVNELLYASDMLADQIALEPFGSSELRSLEGQIEKNSYHYSLTALMVSMRIHGLFGLYVSEPRNLSTPLPRLHLVCEEMRAS